MHVFRFSENSITLAADTLLRNTNKDGGGELITGSESSFLDMKVGALPGAVGSVLTNG